MNNNNVVFPFLQLPGELRNRIYDAVIDVDGHGRFISTKHHSRQQSTADQLSRVNRQLRHELLPRYHATCGARIETELPEDRATADAWLEVFGDNRLVLMDTVCVGSVGLGPICRIKLIRDSCKVAVKWHNVIEPIERRLEEQLVQMVPGWLSRGVDGSVHVSKKVLLQVRRVLDEAESEFEFVRSSMRGRRRPSQPAV